MSTAFRDLDYACESPSGAGALRPVVPSPLLDEPPMKPRPPVKSRRASKLTYPPRKISAAFIDYVSPILDSLGLEPGDQGSVPVMKIAHAVWNALVFEQARGDRRFIESLQQSMEGNAFGDALLTRLIERRRQHFADDLRVIGNYEIKRKWHGGLSLWAEAKDPFSSPADGRNAG